MAFHRLDEEEDVVYIVFVRKRLGERFHGPVRAFQALEVVGEGIVLTEIIRGPIGKQILFQESEKGGVAPLHLLEVLLFQGQEGG